MSDIFQEWRARIEAELTAAAAAREAGMEGRARVCARRAAGWAAGICWMIESDATQVPPSALESLGWLIDRAETPEALREKARRLTTQVTEDHRLPHPEDPLQDARDLVRQLLKDSRRRSESGDG